MPTTRVRMVSFFSISYIRLHLLLLSFQFVAMVVHLLHFAKHVCIDWSSHVRRPILMTVPLDKIVERSRVVVIWDCDNLARNEVAIRFCFHRLYVLWFCYIFTHTHILYAVWCFPVRREGRQYLSRPLSSRHWLSACAVGSLQGPCHPYRCVPIRCNIYQSYSINIAGALHCDVVLFAMFAHPSLA